MIIHGTYQDLANLHADIEKQQKASPAFSFFNREKIKNFYGRNRVRIELLQKKIEQLKHDHIIRDVEGNYVTEKIEGTDQWVFKTEADKEEYNIGYEALVSFGIEIHC